MNKSRAATVIALGFSLTVTAAEPSPHPVDVTNFDISGVRLYMTGAETVAALREKLGKSVEVAYRQPGTGLGKYKGDYIEAHYSKSSLSPDGKIIDVIQFRSGAYRGEFTLADRAEEDGRGAEAVAHMEIHLTNQNQSDWESFKNAIMEKYGPPSLTTGVIMWCATFKEGFGPQCDMNHAKYMNLMVDGVQINDPMYGEKIRQMLAKRQAPAGKAPL